MPTISFPGVNEGMSVAQLADLVARLIKEVQWLLNGNLDTLNLNKLDAKIVVAGSITADKLDVAQLSAISANLGTITAGTLTTNTTINVGTDARIGNILYLNETDGTSQKGIIFSDALGDSVTMEALQGDLEIRTDGFITFTIGSSMGLVVNEQIIAPDLKATNSITLNGQPVALESGVSGTWYVASTSGGPTTTALTFTNGILTSAV